MYTLSGAQSSLAFLVPLLKRLFQRPPQKPHLVKEEHSDFEKPSDTGWAKPKDPSISVTRIGDKRGGVNLTQAATEINRLHTI